MLSSSVPQILIDTCFEPSTMDSIISALKGHSHITSTITAFLVASIFAGWQISSVKRALRIGQGLIRPEDPLASSEPTTPSLIQSSEPTTPSITQPLQLAANSPRRSSRLAARRWTGATQPEHNAYSNNHFFYETSDGPSHMSNIVPRQMRTTLTRTVNWL